MQRHVVLGHSKAEPICVGGAGQHVLDVADRNACRSLPGVVALIGVVAALAHTDTQQGAGIISHVSLTIYPCVDAHIILPLLVAAKAVHMLNVHFRLFDDRRAVRRVEIIVERIGIIRVQTGKAQGVELFLALARNCFKRKPVLIAKAADRKVLIRADGQPCRGSLRLVRFVAIAVQDLRCKRPRADRIGIVILVHVQSHIVLARFRGVEIQSAVSGKGRIAAAGSTVCHVAARVKDQLDLLVLVGVIVARNRQRNVLSGLCGRDLKVVVVSCGKSKLCLCALI